MDAPDPARPQPPLPSPRPTPSRVAPGRFSSTWRLAQAAFVVSGASGLVFELVWSRQFAAVFGVSSLALAAVLSTFMAGLALGGGLAARRASRLRSPLLAYGLLEIGVGLSTLAVAPALRAAAPLRTAIWQAFEGAPAWVTLGDFALSFAVLLLPTTLMGATLPVLGQALRGTARQQERGAGALYALNTAGAVLGAAAAGLVLLPRLGLSTTALLASSCNLLLGSVIAALAVLAQRHAARGAGRDAALEPQVETALSSPSPPALGPEDPAAAPANEEAEAQAAAPEAPEGPGQSRHRVAAVLAAAFLGSAAGMAYQILWSRGLAVVLGSSTYSFTLLLVAYLLGLAGGGALAAAWLPRLRRPLLALGSARLLVALGAAPCLLFLDRVPSLVLGFLRWADTDPGVVLSFTFVVAVAVVLLPTLAMGASFPLALAAARGEGSMGRRLGRVYVASTLGSILGSALGGFVLLPWLGLRLGISAVVLVDLGVAAALGALAARRGRARGAWAVVAVALVAAALVPTLVPRWNSVRLTSGLYRMSLVKEVYQDADYTEPEQLLYRDGLAATVTVERRGDLIILKSNGKVEASSQADMPTQVLASMLPSLLHPAPHSGLLVGLASGVTAGAALASGLDSLTVVELEPAMVEASRFFEPLNHRPLDDPRTRLILGDGRNVLTHTGHRFDVIISEPSNPWIAGVASLFTSEAFQQARARLAPGGIFCQWLQLYEISPANVTMVLRTFRQVFPHVMVFSSLEKGVDLLLLGSESPIPLSRRAVAERLRVPAVAAEAARAFVHSPEDLFARIFLGPDELAPFAGEGPLNTDDNALLEFSAPLDLIAYDRHEDFFRGYYHQGRAYGRVAPLLPDLRPEEQGALALALLRHGKDAEARELALSRRPAGDPQAEVVLALDALAQADLEHPGRGALSDLPGTIAGVPRPRMARFWNLLERGLARDALELLAQLPARAGADPAYATLAGYCFLRQGMAASAVEVLAEVAGASPSPVASLLLGRALLEQQRYREGYDWLAWSLHLQHQPAADPQRPPPPPDAQP